MSKSTDTYGEKSKVYRCALSIPNEYSKSIMLFTGNPREPVEHAKPHYFTRWMIFLVDTNTLPMHRSNRGYSADLSCCVPACQ